MYNWLTTDRSNLNTSLEFINDNHYEIVSVVKDDWEYTIFYKDNKKTW